MDDSKKKKRNGNSWDQIRCTRWGYLSLRVEDDHRSVTFKAEDDNNVVFLRGTARSYQHAAEKSAYEAVKRECPDWFEKPDVINPYVWNHIRAMTPDLQEAETTDRLRRENVDLKLKVGALEQEIERLRDFIAGKPHAWVRKQKAVQGQGDWAKQDGDDGFYDPKAKRADNGKILVIQPGQEGTYEDAQKQQLKQQLEESIEAKVDDAIAESNARVVQKVRERLQDTPRRSAERRTQAGFLTSGELQNGGKTINGNGNGHIPDLGA